MENSHNKIPFDSILKYVRKEFNEAGIQRINQLKQKVIFKMWIRIVFRESPLNAFAYIENLWLSGYFKGKVVLDAEIKPKVVQELNPKIDIKAYYSYLKTKKWAKIRQLVLTRDNNKCRMCERKGLLHIHHLTYEHLFNETTHLDDLVTLCDKCHSDIHGRKNGKNTIPLSETSKVFNIKGGY